MPFDGDRPIKVNQILGIQPRLGPLPANQILPWALFTLFSYFVCQGYFALGWLPMVLLDGWLISTWWIVTGERSWRFLSKVYPPVPQWQRGCTSYQSFLAASNNGSNQKETRQKKGRN